MAIKKFEHTCGKLSGGIKAIHLIDVSQVEHVEYNHRTEHYRAITVKDGAAFAQVHFKEDMAEFTELVTFEKGVCKVVHTLRFTIERMDFNSCQAVEQLVGSSRDGMIAIVTFMTGEVVIVGYSERFGTERALRLNSSNGDCGMKPSGLTAEQITLSCCDSSKAKAFTGLFSVV